MVELWGCGSEWLDAEIDAAGLAGKRKIEVRGSFSIIAYAVDGIVLSMVKWWKRPR